MILSIYLYYIYILEYTTTRIKYSHQTIIATTTTSYLHNTHLLSRPQLVQYLLLAVVWEFYAWTQGVFPCAVPPRERRPRKICNNCFVSPPTPTQWADRARDAHKKNITQDFVWYCPGKARREGGGGVGVGVCMCVWWCEQKKNVSKLSYCWNTEFILERTNEGVPKQGVPKDEVPGATSHAITGKEEEEKREHNANRNTHTSKYGYTRIKKALGLLLRVDMKRPQKC